MNSKTNDILNDIIHTASQAILAEDEAIKRQALGDISCAIASLVPGERAARSAAPTEASRDGRARTPAAPQGFAKFLHVADDVQFVRFPGKNETRLVASRRAKNGNAKTIFEIKVDHADNFAQVFRDGKPMFDIQGDSIGHSIVEKLAISSMHRYLKEHQMTNEKKKRRRARKAALRAGILTPAAELAETVARQKEMDEPTTVGCPALRMMKHLPSGFDGVEPSSDDLENA